MFLSTSGMSSCPALPPKSSTVRRPRSTASYETAASTPSSPGNGTTGPSARSARYALALRSRSPSSGFGGVPSSRSSPVAAASAVIDQPFHESVEGHEPVVRKSARHLDDLPQGNEALHAACGQEVAQLGGARLRVDPD